MKTWSFGFVLSGFDRPIEEALDALFEAGCDDASLLERGITPVLEFDREAETLEAALLSALHDVEQADVGTTVVRVEPDDLVSPADIARRTGKSREAVRKWTEGEVSGFPPPVALLEKRTLWSWCEVSAWLAQRDSLSDDSVETARVLAALNHFIDNQRSTSLRPQVNRFSSKLVVSSMAKRLRQLQGGTEPQVS